MKSTLFFLLISFSFSSFSADVDQACFLRAERAVEYSVDRTKYDINGFHTQFCYLAPSKSSVICDVYASKGGGAATDSYRVILHTNCHKVYRIDLTGEE